MKEDRYCNKNFNLVLLFKAFITKAKETNFILCTQIYILPSSQPYALRTFYVCFKSQAFSLLSF